MDSSRSVCVVAVLGLSSLAAAMGIGRFAFTPLLPLMQQEFGVTLQQGAWLATANYAGYFFGAIASFRLMRRPGAAVRYALVVVAVTTAAMAVTEAQWVWTGLRFTAGVASAFVLIGASEWTLNRLSALGRSDMSGWVFSGVGVGIVIAGAVTLAFGSLAQGTAVAWLLLGACAGTVAVAGWTNLVDDPALSKAVLPETGSAPLSLSDWSLIICYGAFGFGYIIPATFIPTIARTLVDDARVFGWAWPFFGAAAAASTVLAMRYFRNTPSRTVAVWSLVVMAIGVVMPAIAPSIGGIIFSSLCVGGTFMVMTMAGIQEARRMSPGSPTRLIAAMTAAFAVGQLVGPMLVGVASRGDNSVALPSLIAFGVLIAAAVVLARDPAPLAARRTL